MLSLVVPIFNEEEIIPILHTEIVKVMDRTCQKWEVVYVDDGSKDRSLEMLLEYQSKDMRVVVIELSRNWGHQSALMAGLSFAKGDAVILMDGDMQDPPEIILQMQTTWEKGAQVVIAERTSREEKGLRKILFSLFYKTLGYLSDYPIPLNAGIFGLLDRKVVDAINLLTESNRYLPGLRAWVGFKTQIIYYQRKARIGGEPKQTFWRLLKYGLDAIFSFSYKPLRLSLVLGLLTSLFSVVYGFILIICRVNNIGMFGEPVVVGYTSTIISILFIGGVQLICVGVIGEYLGRIYDEVKRRPQFFINSIHKLEKLPKTNSTN